MYCSKCGKENKDTNIYCNHCGEKLKKDTTKTNNTNISDRFTLENNIIVVVAMLILFIIVYILTIKMLVPTIPYTSFPINLISLAMEIGLTGMLVWNIYYLCQRAKAGDNILIIDNGFTGLDIDTPKRVVENLSNKNKKTTLVIISSMIEDIKNADKIYKLENKTLVEMDEVEVYDA